MRKQELARRLENFRSEQPVTRFEISQSVAADFQVELILKPNTPITERFIALLETALHQKIGSLSLFRVRRNIFIIRFTLKRNYYDDSAADRIQELPSPYACGGQEVLIRTTIPQKLAAGLTNRPTRSFQVFGPTRSFDGRRGGSSH
ncbi:MAG TPA: hypothetical protein VN857_03185 [Chthoniobacterales bacterium]|jgi:hypothetical protein|nr:hypothetical protein [Chthoniobacterales bacterium]